MALADQISRVPQFAGMMCGYILHTWLTLFYKVAKYSLHKLDKISDKVEHSLSQPYLQTLVGNIRQQEDTNGTQAGNDEENKLSSEDVLRCQYLEMKSNSSSIRQDPLEATLVSFGHSFLIFFFAWKVLEKYKTGGITFVRMRSSDHLGNSQLSKKGTSIALPNWTFNKSRQMKRFLQNERRNRGSSWLNKSEEAWSLMWNAICCEETGCQTELTWRLI